MTAIRETCPCGAKIRVQHPDPAPIAADWRNSHPCDRRNAGEREVVAGATVETVFSEPHRTDSDLRDRLGFGRRHPDDTEPLPLPPPTRRDLREVRL